MKKETEVEALLLVWRNVVNSTQTGVKFDARVPFDVLTRLTTNPGVVGPNEEGRDLWVQKRPSKLVALT